MKQRLMRRYLAAAADRSAGELRSASASFGSEGGDELSLSGTIGGFPLARYALSGGSAGAGTTATVAAPRHPTFVGDRVENRAAVREIELTAGSVDCPAIYLGPHASAAYITVRLWAEPTGEGEGRLTLLWQKGSPNSFYYVEYDIPEGGAEIVREIPCADVPIGAILLGAEEIDLAIRDICVYFGRAEALGKYRIGISTADRSGNAVSQSDILLDEPLRMLGGAADQIERDKTGQGMLRRQIREITLSSESFSALGLRLNQYSGSNGTKYPCLFGRILSGRADMESPTLFSHGRNVGIKAHNGQAAGYWAHEYDQSSRAYFYWSIDRAMLETFRGGSVADGADFVQAAMDFCDAEAAAGRPVTVWYVIDEESEELALPALRAAEGGTVLSLDSTVLPSKIEMSAYCMPDQT